MTASISLVLRQVRAVSEGSTLVMRAINTNQVGWVLRSEASLIWIPKTARDLLATTLDALQENAMKKAIAIAPRGKRAMELLNISVGAVLSSS